MTEVVGVNLEIFEDPIRKALVMYQDVAEDRVQFDIPAASILGATPDKSTSARSVSPVLFRSDTGRLVNVGDLAVIVFKPFMSEADFDGTGDASLTKLEQAAIDKVLPYSSKILPRSKTDMSKKARDRIYNEGHLTIATQKVNDSKAIPELFDGALDLVGHSGKIVQKIATLGHTARSSAANIVPNVNLTVGYRLPLRPKDKSERFGDPHAVYNPLKDTLQVAGFLAITNGVFKKYGDVLAHLGTKEPAVAQPSRLSRR